MNDKTKSYSFKDLMTILQTGYSVVEKKVKKYKFKTDKQVINSRLTTVVLLTDSELEALKQETEFNKNKYSPNNNILTSDNSAHNVQPENVDTPTIEFIKSLVEKIEDKNNKILHEKDKQLLMLEDIEKRKENEYLQQIAELKGINQQLTEQLEKSKQKSFFGLKFGK